MVLTRRRLAPPSGRFVHVRAGRRWTLASRVLVLQLLVVLVVVLGATAALGWQLRADTRRDASVEVTDVAAAVAQAPPVREGLADPPGADRVAVRDYVESVRAATGVDFVTVMDRDAIRWTHPDPAEVGRPFLGHAEAALAGGRVVETYTGTLGPSVRAVLPVRAADGRVVGAVAVGVTTRSVTADLLDRLPVLLLALALALALSVAGSWALSRWVRRATHGLEPADLTRLWEVNDAVLHSLREGLVVLDPAGRVQVVNDEARRLLPATADGSVDLPPAVQRLLGAPGDVVDDLQVTDDRVLVVNRLDARWEGRRVGTVVTLRDHTELQALTRDLDAVRGLADALRAQAHEAANRLHVVVTLVEQGQPERAVAFATSELAAAQQLTDLVVADVADPAVAALLIGKSAQADERGVELEVEPDTALADGLLPARDLVTVVGNLVDNAVEAALDGENPRWVRVRITAGDEVEVRVTDSGEGLPAGWLERAMQRGWSRKEHRLAPEGSHGLGLALVGQVVRRHGGTIAVEEPVTLDDGGGTIVVRLPLAAPPGGAR
ncbi:sensor histidine kinase [Kineococcus radiotolerans]|uniref:histidine kinase n=1 Tax=Kineococcus radiotolerans (strain ATCC BAA-149 / DSM 14245 / SRS30216) TaxID=266940 RepID=A6W5B6_KINRD|nr:ATP-binding protein [Kineococcus radiotolerans]ABS02005.1 signal transduction histidine kinase regulating citrate/malate metabolism [Kineococcus radiotolerans SRS30216 = ATCC BAA-149]